MDQAFAAEPGGRRTGTLLRALLLALGAVAGGILLSLVLGGPARADAPSGPSSPPVTSASSPGAASPGVASPDASLLGRVTEALSDVTQTVVAPVDRLVTTLGPVERAVPAAPVTSATPAAPAVSHVTATAGAVVMAVPTALDGALDSSPLAATPLWQRLIGPQPARELLTPVAQLLRPVERGLAEALLPSAGPVLEAAGDAVAVSPSIPEATGSGAGAPRHATSPSSSVSGAAPPASPHHPLPPSTDLGGAPDLMLTASSAGPSAPALVAGFAAMLLLALSTVRRTGWVLPASPVFGTDVSPD